MAARAIELLDHKQLLLRREQRRFSELSARTRREWESQAADAQRWHTRALVAGGRDALRRAVGATAPAQARLTWTSEVGVTYPSTASVELAAPPPLAGTAALAAATGATRVALGAAVRYAAATTALARVDAELTATIRRLRALRDRWLPHLEEQLAALDLRLDETEREEATRLRWARPATTTGTESP